MMTKIPHPPRSFLVGNLPQIAGKDTMAKMTQLGYEWGPIFEIAVLNIKLVFICNHLLAKEVLSDEELFPKFIDKPAEHLRVIAGDGLFTARTDEPNWKKAHNVLMPGFSQRSMRGYVPAMKSICDRLLEKWNGVAEGKYINLSEDMTRYTFETIGLCGFDYNFDSFKTEEEHQFITAMLYALDEAVDRARTPPFMLPFRFKKNYTFNKHLAYVNNLIDEIIEKRKKNPAEYTNKFDFLSLMMNAKDKESGEKLSDVNIRYQILTFMVAGHETTSGLLSFVFYNLLSNPEWLDQVYEEVDRVLGPDPNCEITHKEVAQMKLIRRVLFETLRLYPPVPIINVAPTKKTTIGKEAYPVEKNQSILIWPYHLHRDKSVWGDDPETFNPDHFLPERVAARDSFAFKAFGNGQRACIGRQFAMTEAAIAVAMVLQQYKLHLREDYEFGFNTTITLRPKDLYVRLEKRTAADRHYQTAQVLEENDVTADLMTCPHHGSKLLILYGSNMGSSQELATQIAKDGKRNGFAVTLAELDAYTSNFPTEGLVQIITSTYNGTPPDNARKFADWLAQTSIDLSKLQYAVFGCGNSQWTTFQSFPNLVDKKLEQLGASRMYTKGTADASVDFDADFEQWYQGYWPNLMEALGLETKTNHEAALPSWSIEKQEGVIAYQCPVFTPKGHTWMGITKVEELQQVALSGRSTVHVEVALPSDASYQEGDYLMILPKNSRALVERVCKRFDIDAHQYIKINSQDQHAVLPIGETILLRDLLECFVELQQPIARRQLKILIEVTTCPPEKMKLQAYEKSFETEVANKRSILSLLEEMPGCELKFEDFLEMLPSLQSRYYSIASCSEVEGQSCSLTIAVLKDQDFEGVCSNYLSKLKIGTKVLAQIKRPNIDFSLPTDSQTPIIMIGAGTGLAPFRGFIQKRAYQKEQGMNLGKAQLFFGCRHPEEDFLYQSFLEQAAKDQIIDLRVAFSRAEEGERGYVQHKLLEAAEAVWELLENGAIIYICGDALGMAKGVEEALMAIYKRFNPSQSAQDWIAEMKREGRYKTEIWTS